ncbi:MAG: flavodoxin family protein [Clostridium sp.]|jgi:multimeric flavodoxin WrbA|uniref:flavodoxin family protein n=1 Tax=Clostridium sp. TaxID=1506 RepID=UPI0025C2C078|nr:flavodoxin family protein [Clostridium sp.]MCH3963921.1 flavodoxin family protein [Clostridium sp.]MCI1716122.1 flavodoxin family protein [Clostridium sp.]MCI1800638.1 flavodoxin family protein [Clostridium sp.]MCI1814299.1 flavodoxin family protein [Clostridium sp.]MCI1871198.1 flavodoxin family protein [Clostridium sp.]
MKVIAVNGSPRKNKNTATLLNKALEGAASKGAETELIHLYELNYKGCVSCFACKIKNGINHGRCGFNDDLTSVLQKAEKADAIILGSPIYLQGITGVMKSFLERLIFPYLKYDKNHSSIFGRKISTGFIYTMNVTNEQMKKFRYRENLRFMEEDMERIFGICESLTVNDTYQFDDYSKYNATLFDENKKAKVRKEQFPRDCKAAFDMGVRFVEQASI